MFTAAIVRRRSVLLALGAGLLAGAGGAHAGVVTVKNNGKDAVTFSDLIAYGKPDKDGKRQQQVLKKPGFAAGDAADDETLAKDEQRVFVTDFAVDKIFVSQKVGNSEVEWKTGLQVDQPIACNTFVQPGSGLALYSVLFDMTSAFTSLEDGTMVSFQDGYSADLPGYFVGTQVDFDTGDIHTPFSGVAMVAGAGLWYGSDIPSPGSAALLALGGLAAARRRR